MITVKNNNKKDDGFWWGAGLELFLKLSSWIVAPILIAVFVGKKLDVKYGTEPKFFLTAVAVAFLISISGMISSGLKEIKRNNSDKRENK